MTPADRVGEERGGGELARVRAAAAAGVYDRLTKMPEDTSRLRAFVKESNRIEGLYRVTRGEMAAHARLLALAEVAVPDLEAFVADVAGRPLRKSAGMNVRVGNHVPPPGGPYIEAQLAELLAYANDGADPYRIHVRYETLHPFMDGNGRSGRALWAWQMLRSGQDPFALPFLHRFYYQALDGARDVAHDNGSGDTEATS